MAKYNIKKIETGYSWRDLSPETLEQVKELLKKDSNPNQRDREITQISPRHYKIPVGAYSKETVNFLSEIYPSKYPKTFGMALQIGSGLFIAGTLSYVIYNILDKFGGK